MKKYRAVTTITEPSRYVVKFCGLSGWDVKEFADCGPASAESQANAKQIALALNAYAKMPAIVEALDRVACAADTAAHFLRKSSPDEAALFRADARVAREAVQAWRKTVGPTA